MTAQDVQSLIPESVLATLQALSPEQLQQVFDFVEFLAQRQQSKNGERSVESSPDVLPAQHWVEQISGTFKDDPVFEEILRYGREYRQSTYPGDELA